MSYGTSRRLIFAYGQCYFEQHGVRSLNWLVPNAYGPGDYSDPMKVHALNGIIIRLLKAQHNGDTAFSIWGTGTPMREWIYSEDAINIISDNMDLDLQIEPMNIAQCKGYSIKEIVTLACEALDYFPQFEYDTSKTDGAPIKILNDAKFRGFYPDFKFTELKTGIKNTINYYKELI